MKLLFYFALIKSIVNSAMIAFYNTGSAMFTFRVAKENSAETSASRLIIMLIMAVVFVIIAVELMPTLFGQVASATNNSTWLSNPYISPALGLVKLIGLLFVVGIVVGMIALFLHERD